MRNWTNKGVILGFFGIIAVLLSSPATLVTQVGLNFTGSTYNVNSTAIPPDCNGVVGPNHYVEFINGRFAVYNKSNGSLLMSETDLSFWRAAGITFPRGWDVTDPRIIYDPVSQRWFASQVDFNQIVNSNHFLLAVSASSAPTTWTAFSISSDPGGDNFADFPTLGIDSQGVYLSGDMFDPAGDPVGPTLLSIPKAALLTTPPTITGRTWFGIMSYASRGYILQPAICLDDSVAGNVLGTGGLGFNFNTGNFETDYTLVASKIQNAAGPGSATLSSSTVLNVPGYTAPNDPTQPDGSSNLDDGDARFSASVRRVGNVLFAVHNTEVNNLAAIRWYRINATNNVVLESGTITDPIQDLFYPSIAANTNGTVVIAFNGSSIENYVSCYAAVGQTVNGVTTFGGPILLQSGSASYQNTDSSGTSRWGDYSSTCVDPSDPTQFWTIQMYPSGPATWSTQISQLLTGPLKLTISAAGQNVLISWPASATSFQLQSSTTLGPTASWSIVPLTPNIIGNTASVLLPALSPQRQFFRLIQSQ
jgi:hypothetical protein